MLIYESKDDGALYLPSTIEAEMAPADIAERYTAYELTHPSGAPLTEDEPVCLFARHFAQGEPNVAEILRRRGCLRPRA